MKLTLSNIVEGENLHTRYAHAQNALSYLIQLGITEPATISLLKQVVVEYQHHCNAVVQHVVTLLPKEVTTLLLSNLPEGKTELWGFYTPSLKEAQSTDYARTVNVMIQAGWMKLNFRLHWQSDTLYTAFWPGMNDSSPTKAIQSDNQRIIELCMTNFDTIAQLKAMQATSITQ